MRDGARGAALALPVVVLMAGALVGCGPGAAGPPAPEGPAEVRGIEMKVELNPDTGAVVLPADRFVETPLEMDLLSTAGAAAVSQCAAEAGVTFVPPPPLQEPVYSSEHYFGPWTTDQAQRFGFVLPMSDRDLAANGIVTSEPVTQEQEGGVDQSGNAELTAEDWVVIDECTSSDPRSQDFSQALMHAGPWYQEFDAASDKVVDQPAAQEALEDLRQCYEDEGLTVADRSWMPRGVDGSAITEGQIRLALTVVECKDAVDFTARMGEVEARLQAPIVAKYADELVAKRAQLDEALTAARALVSE